MSGDNAVAPVIIKRKKVVSGDGHHGGAWKVAYADFVTAMMAFFMLMWLLNATTEKQRKGIADYFTPTVAIARVSGGGDGALGGDSVLSEETLPLQGRGATSDEPTEASAARGFFSEGEQSEAEAEDEQFREIESQLMGRSGESMVADEALEHIVSRITDEGLVVELHATPRGALFDPEGRPTELLRRLTSEVVRAGRRVTNAVAVEAHVAAAPLVVQSNPSWNVSSGRAEQFRTLLSEEGFDEERIRRLTSHADREPVTDNPMSIRNNRLEIVFLRR